MIYQLTKQMQYRLSKNGNDQYTIEVLDFDTWVDVGIYSRAFHSVYEDEKEAIDSLKWYLNSFEVKEIIPITL